MGAVGGTGVEMRPECVHGVLKSSRKSLGEVPEARGGRQEGVLPRWEQKTLAFEATRALSKLRDGAGPPFIWEMSAKYAKGHVDSSNWRSSVSPPVSSKP